MQNADWIAVFRQIPPDVHSQIILVLQNRLEVSIETIFRVEPTHLLLRGRMSGTTDGGLTFLVPFDQLTSMYLFRDLREAEVEKYFGASRVAGASKSNQGTAAKPKPESAPEAEAAPPEDPALRPSNIPSPAAAMPAFGRPTEATAVARNNLLERLRAARQAAQPPK